MSSDVATGPLTGLVCTPRCVTFWATTCLMSLTVHGLLAGGPCNRFFTKQRVRAFGRPMAEAVIDPCCVHANEQVVSEQFQGDKLRRIGAPPASIATLDDGLHFHRNLRQSSAPQLIRLTLVYGIPPPYAPPNRPLFEPMLDRRNLLSHPRRSLRRRHPGRAIRAMCGYVRPRQPTRIPASCCVPCRGRTPLPCRMRAQLPAFRVG